MRKTIVTIPGSVWQIPIVNKIRSMGYRALVVNPYRDSPAFQYADGYLQADIFDEKAVLRYCREEGIDAIVSEECDIAMPALAKYGKALGCTVLSEEAAHLFTDKLAMREFGKTHGLPVPEYRMCSSCEEAIFFFKSFGKKMIMKPLDSNSSRGVFTISCVEDIVKHFDETKSFSHMRDTVLLERYIEGVEFTVDGIKTPDKHFSLAISEKQHFKHNKNIASELYFTYQNDKFDYDLLRKINDSLIDLSPLCFGLTHTEYKYKDGTFYLIEMAARGGGNLISSDIVPFMSEVDNYKYLINCSLGKISSPEFGISDSLKDRAAVLKFFETPESGGVVNRIQGIDYLQKCSEIRQFKFNFSIGDKINPATDDSTRVGFYIACCDSKERLDEVIENVDKRVKIEIEHG